MSAPRGGVAGGAEPPAAGHAGAGPAAGADAARRPRRIRRAGPQRVAVAIVAAVTEPRVVVIVMAIDDVAVRVADDVAVGVALRLLARLDARRKAAAEEGRRAEQ